VPTANGGITWNHHAKQMKTKTVAADSLIPYVRNPRKNSAAVDKVAASIKEYGWQQPIVVDKESVIIAGHTRMLAAQKLGMDEVPVHVADLTDAQAKAYRLADNRIAENADWDIDLLGLEIRELDDLGFELDLTGFDNTELANLLIDEELEPEDKTLGNMVAQFGVPPFSVLDTRQKYWQERKRQWGRSIGDQGESRENTLAAKGSMLEGIGSASILDAVLAELVCRWFGKSGFSAFDCFAGDTVFGYVAASCGLEFTGIELRLEQARLNNERTKELSANYICDDGRNLGAHISDESMDLFFSCPPYADLEVYSDDPRDLSNMGHEDFFKILESCLSQVYRKLKDNRFAVVVISEVRNKVGKYIGTVPAIINVMVESGFNYWNELILVNSAGTLPMRAGRPMHTTRKVGRTHQNVLVFFKGDQKQIADEFGEVGGGLEMGASD